MEMTMASLRKTIIDLARHRKRWEEMQQGGPMRRPPGATGHLQTVEGFGSNPGHLALRVHVPASMRRAAPLVVVLHGCTQTAASYDDGSGWSRLADEHGFALAFPEQRSENNPKLCFNWFDPRHTARGLGEAQSVAQMIEHMIVAHGLDRSRIYITGLSAGGAMTAVMLATYPELFAAGAIIAGLPYGSANDVQQAFQSMFNGRVRTAREWGHLVRRASPHRGPWPKVSIWHGSDDTTVKPINAEELAKQWTDVHGLRLADGERLGQGDVSGRRWRDGAGETLVEEVLVQGLAHGTPVDGRLDGFGASPPPFMLDVGISSTRRLAAGWGLTGHEKGRGSAAAWMGHVPAPVLRDPVPSVRANDASPNQHWPNQASSSQAASSQAASSHDSPRQEKNRPEDANRHPSLRVGEVIDRALRRAGLLGR
jgi:poly(hydroxyalkanoate) depolymerase family esterase